MQSLLTSVTQSQLITHPIHDSKLFYRAATQNTNFKHNSPYSPSSHYGQLATKTQNQKNGSIFQSNVSVQNKNTYQWYKSSVSRSFQQQFISYNHQQKISCLLDVVRIYRKLILQHGLFLLTKEHLKVDSIGRAMVFINPDIYAIQPSLPLNNNKQNELKAVQQLVDLFRKHFSELFFKYAKIRTLQDLQNFFIVVKKRNQIHKICKRIVREMSRSKFSSSMRIEDVSPHTSASKRFDLQQRPSSRFGTFPTKSSILLFKSSKFLDQPKKFDLETNVSSNIIMKNQSYLEIRKIGKKVDAHRKSCPLQATQKEGNPKKLAKISSMSNNNENRNGFTRFKWKENKQRAQSCEFNQKEMKSSLQLGFQDLFLNQIVQDIQSEILNSGGGNNDNLNQFFKDFQNVFY